MSRPTETAPRHFEPASEFRTRGPGNDRASVINDGATHPDNTRSSSVLLDQVHQLRLSGSPYAETRDTASPYLKNVQFASAEIGGQYGNSRFGNMLQDAVYRPAETGVGRTGNTPSHEPMHGSEARQRTRARGDRRHQHADHPDSNQPAIGQPDRVQPDRMQRVQRPDSSGDLSSRPDFQHLGHRLNYKERVALDKFIHKDDTVGTKYEGTASFYTSGKHTAEGGRYDKDAVSVASRTLPFGTMVKVTNPANGKSIIARVSDRGPFTSNKHTGEYNRDLDLSRGAFRQLEDLDKGTFKAQWEIVSMPGKN